MKNYRNLCLLVKEDRGHSSPRLGAGVLGDVLRIFLLESRPSAVRVRPGTQWTVWWCRNAWASWHKREHPIHGPVSVVHSFLYCDL